MQFKSIIFSLVVTMIATLALTQAAAVPERVRLISPANIPN